MGAVANAERWPERERPSRGQRFEPRWSTFPASCLDLRMPQKLVRRCPGRLRRSTGWRPASTSAEKPGLEPGSRRFELIRGRPPTSETPWKRWRWSFRCWRSPGRRGRHSRPGLDLLSWRVNFINYIPASWAHPTESTKRWIPLWWMCRSTDIKLMVVLSTSSRYWNERVWVWIRDTLI